MKVTENMTVADMLRGCTAGRVQSVGCMQVIPLVSDISDDRFSAPDDAEVSTKEYGTLVFKNTSDKTMIIPPQTAYVVSQMAQDHALPHAGLVKAKTMKAYKTAVCIQQTQAGLISSGKHQMVILPFVLREHAHTLRKEVDFRRLWGAIGKLNSEAGVSEASGGHLDAFLKHFEKELNAFVAEFEPVNKQVGAIIMINGRVVGIERTPNYSYWKVVWPALIRECYGSLAMMTENKAGAKVPETRVPLRKASSVADLKAALAEATESERVKTAEVVNRLLHVTMVGESESSEADIRVDSVASEGFVGQVVKDGPAVVYGSLIAKQEQLKKDEWESKAKPFAM